MSCFGVGGLKQESALHLLKATISSVVMLQALCFCGDNVLTTCSAMCALERKAEARLQVLVPLATELTGDVASGMTRWPERQARKKHHTVANNSNEALALGGVKLSDLVLRPIPTSAGCL